MFQTLSRVLIFFSFIGLGALLARTGRLSRVGIDGLSAYFYWLAFTLALLAFTFGNTYVAALVDQRIARQIRRPSCESTRFGQIPTTGAGGGE